MSSDGRATVFTLLVVLVTYVSVDTLRVLAVEVVPLGVGYFLGGMGVVLAVGLGLALVHGRLRDRFPKRSFWFPFLLVLVVLWVKFPGDPGPMPGGGTLLLVGAGVLLAIARMVGVRRVRAGSWLLRGRFSPVRSGDGWMMLGLLLMVVSSSYFVSPGSLVRPRWEGGIVFLVAAGFFCFDELKGVLWKRRYAVGLLAALLLVGMGVYWHMVSPGRPVDVFEGSLPEATLASDLSTEELPNVILISIDTLRWDAVPPHTDGEMNLPAMRSLRRDSLQFRRFYSSTSWTLPAHGSLFTGEMPAVHGAMAPMWPIHPTTPIFPQWLQSVGYEVGGVTGGFLVDRRYGFSRGYDYYGHYPFEPDPSYTRVLPGALEWALALSRRVLGTPGPLTVVDESRPESFSRDFGRSVRRARDWITDRPGASRRPFFLFLHSYHVHHWKWNERHVGPFLRDHPDLAARLVKSDRLEQPLTDRQRMDRALVRRVLRSHTGSFFGYRENLLARYPVPEEKRRSFRWDPVGTIGTLEGLSEPEVRRLRRIVRQQFRAQHRLYRYNVASMDRALGDFLRFLERRGLYRDSMIVFTSDHGEGFSLDPLVFMHGKRTDVDGMNQLHEELLRLPLWVKLPGNRKAGETVDELVEIRELFPFLFDLLGVRLPGAGARGSRSVREPGFAGGPVRASMGGWLDGKAGPATTLSVRDDRYRLELEQFADGDTTRIHWELAGSAERPLRERRVPAARVPSDRRGRLERALARFRVRRQSARRRHPSDQRTVRRAPETFRKKLKALGYL